MYIYTTVISDNMTGLLNLQISRRIAVTKSYRRITCQGVVVQWCKSLTLQPKQSGEGLITGKVLQLEHHERRIIDLISTRLILRSQYLKPKTATTPTFIEHCLQSFNDGKFREPCKRRCQSYSQQAN